MNIYFLDAKLGILFEMTKLFGKKNIDICIF